MTDERECRDTPTQTVGVPAQDGLGLAPEQAPVQLRRQFQPRRASRRGCAGPVQECARTVELSLDIGAEVERQADGVAAAVDLVDYGDRAGRPIQAARSGMPGRAGAGRGW